MTIKNCIGVICVIAFCISLYYSLLSKRMDISFIYDTVYGYSPHGTNQNHNSSNNDIDTYSLELNHEKRLGVVDSGYDNYFSINTKFDIHRKSSIVSGINYICKINLLMKLLHNAKTIKVSAIHVK